MDKSFVLLAFFEGFSLSIPTPEWPRERTKTSFRLYTKGKIGCIITAWKSLTD